MGREDGGDVLFVWQGFILLWRSVHGPGSFMWLWMFLCQFSFYVPFFHRLSFQFVYLCLVKNHTNQQREMHIQKLIGGSYNHEGMGWFGAKQENRVLSGAKPLHFSTFLYFQPNQPMNTDVFVQSPMFHFSIQSQVSLDWREKERQSFAKMQLIWLFHW